ncbi:MAG: serine protease, partial [Bradyrhizobium sp.]
MTSLRLFAALFVSILVAAPSLAQERRVPASAGELQLSYAPVVQQVTPAVVNVYATKMVREHNPFLDDPIFRHFFNMPGRPEQM